MEGPFSSTRAEIADFGENACDYRDREKEREREKQLLMSG
jgi:hypothetical protein